MRSFTASVQRDRPQSQPMDSSKPIVRFDWIIMTVPDPPGWRWGVGRVNGARIDITMSGYASTLDHAKRDAYLAVTSRCNAHAPGGEAQTISFLSGDDQD